MEGSNGIHEGRAGPFDGAGRYEVRLKGGKADSLIDEDGGENTQWPDFEWSVPGGPVELADTTLNLPLLETIADLSGGRVVDAAGIAGLAELFLADQRSREEVRETPLWNHWVVLTLFLVLMTTEWVLRRGGGLP